MSVRARTHQHYKRIVVLFAIQSRVSVTDGGGFGLVVSDLWGGRGWTELAKEAPGGSLVPRSTLQPYKCSLLHPRGPQSHYRSFVWTKAVTAELPASGQPKTAIRCARNVLSQWNRLDDRESALSAAVASPAHVPFESCLCRTEQGGALTGSVQVHDVSAVD